MSQGTVAFLIAVFCTVFALGVIRVATPKTSGSAAASTRRSSDGGASINLPAPWINSPTSTVSVGWNSHKEFIDNWDKVEKWAADGNDYLGSDDPLVPFALASFNRMIDDSKEDGRYAPSLLRRIYRLRIKRYLDEKIYEQGKHDLKFEAAVKAIAKRLGVKWVPPKTYFEKRDI